MRFIELSLALAALIPGCGDTTPPRPDAPARPPSAESASDGESAPALEAGAKTETPAEADDGFVFPETSRTWSAEDYVLAKDTFVAIQESAPEKLLRADGPRRDVFAKLASVDEVTAAAAAVQDDMGALFDFGDAMAVIVKLYAARVARELGYGKEHARVTAAYLRLAVLQTTNVVSALGLSLDKLRVDRARLEGLLKMRVGVVTQLGAVLELPVRAPDLLSAAEALDAMVPVLPELVTMLLPEERDAVRQLVEKLAAIAGPSRPSSARAVELLGDPPPALALVSELAEEHRAFGKQQRETIAAVGDSMQRPIELGPEEGGVRYAFPDRTMSAVFDTPPNAMEQANVGELGPVTSKTLGIKDAVGFSRTVTCMVLQEAQSTPPVDTARKILEGMGAEAIENVKVAGSDAWQAELASSTSEAVVRVVPSATVNCIIIAEAPKSLAASVRSKAGAFVESVRIGGPTGVPSAVPR